MVGVNGGFFDEHERPLGLRITRKHLASPPRKADWGIFYTTSEGPFLEHTQAASLERLQRSDFAIQAGPRIITGGRVLKLKPGAHRRTVIGFDGERRVVVLATEANIDLNVLAANLVAPGASGGLGLVEALALDGGPSTGFVARMPKTPEATKPQGARGESAGPDPTASDPKWRIHMLAPVTDAVFVVPKGTHLWFDDDPSFTRLSQGLHGFSDVP